MVASSSPRGWYYSLDGQTTHGPVPSEQLKELVQDGLLERRSRVSPNGWRWYPASRLRDLPWPAPGGAEAAPIGPPYAEGLFSSRQVFGATFLGGVFAGGLLLASNYRRMGRAAEGLVVAFGALLVQALLIIVFLSPVFSSFPFMLLNLAQGGLMALVARALQGAQYEAHIGRGGKPASGWKAFGLLVAGIVVVLVLLGLAFVLMHPAGA